MQTSSRLIELLQYHYNNPQEPAAAVRLQHLLRVSTKIILRRVFEEYQVTSCTIKLILNVLNIEHVECMNILNILNISNILIRLS